VTTFQTTWNSLTFPAEASKDYPVSTRVFTDIVNSRCFILMKNRLRPDGQLFNSWGCNIWERGWSVPLPSRLGSLGEHCKLPQRGPGRSPGRKTSFGIFRAWENTPDLTSPDFFHFPWLFPDHFGISRLFQVFQVSGHPELDTIIAKQLGVYKWAYTISCLFSPIIIITTITDSYSAIRS